MIKQALDFPSQAKVKMLAKVAQSAEQSVVRTKGIEHMYFE
jgi:hypothetical protein